MCNLDRSLETQVFTAGLNLIGKLIESELRANQPQASTDVLTVATQAYSQGKITKNQFMAVINALDESPQTVETRAYVDHPNNREYQLAVKYLNQFR